MSAETEYKITYLPIARQDLLAVVQYMTEKLDAPRAADRFLDHYEQAVERLTRFPYSCPVYAPRRPLTDEIRLLVVDNYAVFYTVLAEKQAVEIRRVVYARMDLEKVLGER